MKTEETYTIHLIYKLISLALLIFRGTERHLFHFRFPKSLTKAGAAYFLFLSKLNEGNKKYIKLERKIDSNQFHGEIVMRVDVQMRRIRAQIITSLKWLS